MQEPLKTLAALAGCSAFPCGLATVAAVEGSSYRRPGARLVLTRDGRRSGSISGGCLEEDMILHLRQVMAEGAPRTLVYDTTRENDLVWGVGLGCNGRITLLLEALSAPPPALEFAQAAGGRRRVGSVLATVYAAEDAALLGTRLALAADGPSWEDGLPAAWRAALAEAAGAALADERSAPRAFPRLEGRPCVFFEYVPPPPRLAILGAGDDARPLARLARDFGWQVTVADPRPAFATPERFPEADEVLVLRPEEAAGRLACDRHTFAVIMTHHYVHDAPFLGALLPRDLAYLGLLGPRKRAERLLGELEAGGLAVTPAMRARLHAPVGLDLGGDTPEAVALSMLSEMQAVLHRRAAGPLRDRPGPIHG